LEQQLPSRIFILFAVSIFYTGLASNPALANKRGMRSIVPEIMARAVDDVIRPGYHRFHTATVELRDTMAALCADPGSFTLEAARAEFSATVIAWSRIEMVRSGPVTAFNRHERVLFYPDPRGTALRQLQMMFADPENFPRDLLELQQKSVAVQGLSALEYALFGTGSNALAGGKDSSETANDRCRYGALVAANMEAIASELHESWSDSDGIAKLWMTPGQDNPVLQHNREALVALLEIAAHGLETITDVRLKAFLRQTPDQDKPKLALLWRSENTFAAATAYLESLRTVFEDSGMTLALPDDAKQTGYKISAGFNEVIALARTFDAPVADVLNDPESRARLVELRVRLTDLKNLLSDDYGKAVGLTAGFFFADGD